MGVKAFHFLKTAVAVMAGAGVATAALYNAQEILDKEIPGGLSKATIAARTSALERLAARIRPGDALILPRAHFGEANFTDLPNDVEISGGTVGKLYLGGRHSGLFIVDCPVGLEVGPPRGSLGKAADGAGLSNSFLWNTAALSGGPFDNVALLEQTTFASHSFHDFKSSVIAYLDYNVPNSSSPGQTKMTVAGDCSGSRIYHMVETNYCNSLPSVIFSSVKGLSLMVGDTEGAKATNYIFNNCTNMLFGIHRMFHSGSRCAGPDVSIKVTGGSGNKFFMSQDIGKPTGKSLDASGSNFEMWGGSFEDACTVPSDALLCFYTPNVFGPGVPAASWHEPAEIQDEVIFKYQGKDIAAGQSATPPKPPLVPATGFPKTAIKKMAAPQYLEQANFGAAVLAAGADPTGRRPSDAAFAKVLATSSTLELPEGTFLVSRPILLNAEYSRIHQRTVGQSIVGRGRTRTIIRATRSDIPVVKFLPGLHPAVAKELADIAPGTKPEKYTGLHNGTIDGGKWGIDMTCVYFAATRFSNLIIKNQTEAGIMSGDGLIGKICEKTTTCNAHEFDQNRFMNIQFQNTGDYGIYNNMGMTDKLFFLECHFTGQKKAGISFNFTHMFNGSIIQCSFTNIDGPGLDMWPINPAAGPGYTPHCTMVESCTFTECGNATRPAIDYNWSESNAVTNTTITNKTKPWKFGFVGTAQAMTNVTVDVDVSKMVSGGAAVALRHTRQVRNARPTGNILRNVTSAGPIKFINDAPAIVNMDTYYANKYDSYAWAYPHLLVDCQFGNAKYAYTLVQTAQNGTIKKEVQITPCADCGTDIERRPQSAVLDMKAGPTSVYDLYGRTVGVAPKPSAVKVLPRGMYLMRQDVTGTRKVPVL